MSDNIFVLLTTNRWHGDENVDTFHVEFLRSFHGDEAVGNLRAPVL